MQAGLDFNTGNPVAFYPNIPSSFSGSSGTTVSTSDSLGNLLFYSDGSKAYNKFNRMMPHGDSLKGYLMWTPSNFCVKSLGNPNQYFLFTVGPE